MTTTPCPYCGRPISPAALLGSMGLGKPKTISDEEREARRARAAIARKSRWPKKQEKNK